MEYPLVLFLCPHGAAKSVLAAALCQRMATARHLLMRAVCAGSEPDPEIAPHVRALLVGEGLEMPVTQPQLVTATLLSDAAYVISMGCRRDMLPLVPAQWEAWDDVPPPSQDLQGAHRIIQQRLTMWLDRWEGRLTDERSA
jgi:arsenate reductase (thioredoxin)